MLWLQTLQQVGLIRRVSDGPYCKVYVWVCYWFWGNDPRNLVTLMPSKQTVEHYLKAVLRGLGYALPVTKELSDIFKVLGVNPELYDLTKEID